MTRLVYLALLMLPTIALAQTPAVDLGKAEARCHHDEHGPALLVHVKGIKDRQGLLKLEVYPSNDHDFLADDAVLVKAGKVFRRVEMSVPAGDDIVMCARIPGPGNYSLTVLHDRDSDHRFTKYEDGIGFGSNPRLHLRQPTAAETRITAGAGITEINLVMNYWRGLMLLYRPLKVH